MSFLEIERLGLRYPDGTQALVSVDLRVDKVERIAVLGRSGAGKSTLLRCVAGALRPTSGTIALQGKRVEGLRGAALREHRRTAGMVFQQFQLVRRLTVIENVLAGSLGRHRSPATWLRRFPSEAEDLAAEALREVGMLEQANKRADQLSGGQQQRVAIARATVQQPVILLADEPIASLDPRSADEVMDLLRMVHEERGIAVFANLHDVDAARRWAERVVGLANGRNAYDGGPDGLTDEALTRIYPDGEEAA